MPLPQLFLALYFLFALATPVLQGYFRSHPQPSERIAHAEQLIAQQYWEGKKQQ
jgi:predicted Zn-dependent protease